MTLPEKKIVKSKKLTYKKENEGYLTSLVKENLYSRDTSIPPIQKKKKGGYKYIPELKYRSKPNHF